MDLTIWISIGMTILLQLIKDPTKKAGMKAICLKIYTSIKLAYMGDPDFQDLKFAAKKDK